jgi:hypothetical protein
LTRVDARLPLIREPLFGASEHPPFLGKPQHPERLLGRHPFVSGCLARDANVAASPLGEKVVDPLADQTEVLTGATGEVVALLLVETIDEGIVARGKSGLLLELAFGGLQLGLTRFESSLRELPDRSAGERRPHEEVRTGRVFAKHDHTRGMVPLSFHSPQRLSSGFRRCR